MKHGSAASGTRGISIIATTADYGGSSFSAGGFRRTLVVGACVIAAGGAMVLVAAIASVLVFILGGIICMMLGGPSLLVAATFAIATPVRGVEVIRHVFVFPAKGGYLAGRTIGIAGAVGQLGATVFGIATGRTAGWLCVSSLIAASVIAVEIVLVRLNCSLPAQFGAADGPDPR